MCVVFVVGDGMAGKGAMKGMEVRDKDCWSLLVYHWFKVIV